MIKKIIRKIKRRLGIGISYKSETSKVRQTVIQFCVGDGCDIGFGGDKIKKEKCIGIDLAIPYTKTGIDTVDVACKIGEEPIPFANDSFDYVYSSRLIEDFEDTKHVLLDFIRVLKNNGNLILVFPDQRVYEKHCIKTGQPLNTYHIHQDMGMDYMLNVINSISNIKYELLLQNNCIVDYNVIIVLKITKL